MIPRTDHDTDVESDEQQSAEPGPELEFEFTFRYGGSVLARFGGGAGKEYLIGADTGCDIVLDIDGVAPRHARLRLSSAGAFLSDLESGVGTYVDGQEIVVEELELRPLQSITFGYAEGELRMEEPSAEASRFRAQAVAAAVAQQQKAEQEVFEQKVAKEREEVARAKELAEREAATAMAQALAARAAKELLEQKVAKEREEEVARVAAINEAAVALVEAAVAKAAQEAKELFEQKVAKEREEEAARVGVMAVNDAAIREVEAVVVRAAQEAADDILKREGAEVAKADAAAKAEGEGDELPGYWDQPEPAVSDGWAEAILQGAVEPRASEFFDLPPVGGEEVSVTWEVWEAQTLMKNRASGVGAGARVDGTDGANGTDRNDRADAEAGTRSVPRAGSGQAVASVAGVGNETDEPDEPDRAGSGVGNGAASTGSTAALPDRSGFLSLTNGFLLKKLAATADSKKEVAELTKQLKQRELALVEAWTRRQAAEEHSLSLTQRLADQGISAGALLLDPRRARAGRRKRFWAAVALVALVGTGMIFKLRDSEARARQAESVTQLLRSVAPQLHREAQAALVAGNLDEALAKVVRALALEPDRAAYFVTLGNVQESFLHIPEAQAAYARALAIDGTLTRARANLELCRAIAATRGGALKAENLYGLHRVMLEEGRLAEALRIAQRIGGDGLILCRTWLAILQASGIQGNLSLNPDGTFDLELATGTNSNLAALHDMPLQSLKAARANISDLTPLSGMPLRHLDLAETMVRDLTVLHGMPLETLDLSNTAVTNLAALHGMPLRELRLDYTAVAEISDLEGLPLHSLSLRATRVQSVASLAQTPLRQLNLARTAVKDLSPLKLAPLEELNLENTPVTDLSPLSGAPLISLVLSGTKVATLEPLRGLPLRELRLVGCGAVESLKPLAACGELERLVLPRYGMDLAPLQGLRRLRFLSYETEAGAEERTSVPSSEETTTPAGERRRGGGHPGQGPVVLPGIGGVSQLGGEEFFDLLIW